jgi:predicted amidohydrolase YtcJ
MSQEEDVKGTLEHGMYADFAILSGDYFSIPVEEINNMVSVLTVVDGKVVYGVGDYKNLCFKYQK